MVSIFSKPDGNDDLVSELIEQIAGMQGQLAAHQAALATLFSFLSSEQQDRFGKEVSGNISVGYPAWLRDVDHKEKRIPEHHLIPKFTDARSSTVYAIQGYDFTLPSSN